MVMLCCGFKTVFNIPEKLGFTSGQPPASFLSLH